MTAYDELRRSGQLLPIGCYDKIIVSFSGGKDSVACVLALWDIGFPRDRMELWHQKIDGDQGDGLMDWPCTDSYVKAFAAATGIPLRYQWKEGGFEGEMLRENAKTSGVYYEDGDGQVQYLPSAGGKESTRRMFPQVSADLSVRWCSALLNSALAG